MAYFDKHGVEYTDDKEMLVRCPQDYEGDFVVPNHVFVIIHDAFVGCTKLTSVVAPNHIDINDHMFEGCKGIAISVAPNGKKYSLTW